MRARVGIALVAVAGVSLLVANATGFGRVAPQDAQPAQGTPEPFEAFDRGSFGASTRIDNPWMPLVPGTRFVYEGTTVDDGETLPHRVEIHVTDLIKVIDGIPAVISWDLDYSDGELVEAELAFFAQDDHGNVWRMGEHPEEYEDGELIDAPTWIAGIQGAKAGISMLADPRPGTPSYSQGWGPGVGFTDRGRVDQLGVEVEVPAGRYTDVLAIAESSLEEGPEAEQLKYFARGVGNVRVGWRGAEESTQEVLELLRIETLGPEAMAELRANALALEQNAYRISPDVYAHTPPAQPHKTKELAANE